MARLAAVSAMALTLGACQDLLNSSNGTTLAPSATPQTVAVVQRNNPLAQLADKQTPQILAAYGGAYHDEKTEKLLAKIVGALTAVPENPGDSFHIIILNSPTINAFALPGGAIFISRGMLALADDASEVAGIIGHEMGHVIANHGVKREQFEEEQALNVRVADEVLSDPLSRAVAIGESKLKIASFSRQQEYQADKIGVKIDGQAGYDPYASARFLQAMEAYRQFQAHGQSNGAGGPDFLADHPSSPDRIAAIMKNASAFGPEGVGDRGGGYYLDGIDGLLYGDSSKEGYVRGRKFLHPALGIGFEVPPGFAIHNTKKAVLADGPGNLAIRFDSVDAPSNMSPTSYLVSGWVAGLVAGSTRQITINGLDAATADATASKWDFKVTVIRAAGKMYRFLVAAPIGSREIDRVAQSTEMSFHLLSAAEKAGLKPLRIRVVTVRPGDSVRSIAANMQGVDDPARLFTALNEMTDGEKLTPGEKVKIVVDQ